MPNIKSAKKRAKQNIYRRGVNLARKTALKTAVKKVLDAVAKGEDIEVAKTLLIDAEAKLSRAKSKGIIHSNTAHRRVSRLAKAVNTLKKD